jgi:hypothetical protein
MLYRPETAKARFALEAPVGSGEEQQPLDGSPAAPVGWSAAFGALHFLRAGPFAGNVSFPSSRFGRSRIEENRAELDPVAFDAAIRLFQEHNRYPVMQLALLNLFPMRVVASRTVHHRAENYILSLPVLPLFKPGHLNGLEFFLVGVFRIVAEGFQADYPFVQIGEAHAQWICFGKLVGKGNSDVLGRCPGQ